MNIKSILLGAAAAATAATGAHAADLPVAPEPVDYVRVCDAFGTGFFYIPGTETCLRVSGRVRVEYRFNDFGDSPNNWTVRGANGTSTRARGYIRLDARTNTEYGLVRAYIDAYLTADSGSTGGERIDLDKAYIQFGGFTFGRAGSFFDFYTGNSYNAQLGQQWSDVGAQWVAAYTAAFGNGFSATISIEDGTYRRYGATYGTGPVTNSQLGGLYGGHYWPDLVAALRVDQGWGSAKIMAALHDAQGSQVSPGGFLVGNYSREVGWAVGAGVTVNLPFLASGGSITLQSVYADGALKYASVNLPAGTYDVDALTGDTSTAWSISGGVYLPFTPTIALGLDASYVDVDLARVSAIDYNRWGVAGTLMWTPVSGLQFGVEGEYRNTDFDGAGDYDEAAVTFRVQRDF